MKVLVIDDHPLVIEAMKQLLSSLDSNIHMLDGRTSADARRLVQEHNDIHLVLLDLDLGGEDGIDLIPELRELAPSTPIVVLSANEHPDMVRAAIDLGAMGFIPKTSSSELMLSALRVVFAGGVYLPPEAMRKLTASTTSLFPGVRRRITSVRDLGLTQRQIDVLTLLVQGKSNKVIGWELKVSESTVKVHVAALLKTLNVANRTQVVLAIGKLGIELPRVTPNSTPTSPLQ